MGLRATDLKKDSHKNYFDNNGVLTSKGTAYIKKNVEEKTREKVQSGPPFVLAL